MSSSISEKRIILAVDDKITNLKVLIKYLERSGYELMVAQSGEKALKHIEQITPDLILLDVLMPGMDGFETCRLLKEKDETQDIPIIFMTALTETADKVRGFEMGATDYITKPLQYEEVLARVNAHMTIRKYQQQLLEQNVMLQQKNAQLKKYTDKINADVDRARIVQQQFLPSSENMPCSDKIDWAHCFEPADQVGGDYFDVGVIEENCLAIIFSDVCGHGMSAAFITAVIKTTFQAWLDSAEKLSKLGTNLNTNLYRLTPSDSFAAVFIATYDLITGKFQYINFGHNPEPWLIPSEKNKPLQPLINARSLVMGFQEKIDFQIAEFRLQPGDSMIFVSDGIVENCDPDAELFGTDWFGNILKKNRSLPVGQLIKEIKKNTQNYACEVDQLDDSTILAFRIKN